MPYIELKNIIRKLDIQRGDVLLVSSDMKRILFQAFEKEENVNLDILIESLQDILGSEGTLLFPTFNWDFCKGIAFDYKKTVCKTGALPKAALKRADFKRTKHPIYSFAVWGKDAEILYAMENKSAFGSNSPFAYLHQMNAKNLIIDISYQHCFTFVHYVEEQTEEVHYRYNKEFTTDYIDEKGVSEKRTYSMFVRRLELDVCNTIEPMDPVFVKEGVVRKYMINDIPYKLVELAKAYSLIQEDIKNNHSRRLCTYQGQD